MTEEEEMIQAGQFVIDFINKQDTEKKSELLFETIGAFFMLTKINMAEKKRIAQQVLLELDEIDKKSKSVT